MTSALRVAAITTVLAVATACGGGGGGDPTETPTTPDAAITTPAPEETSAAPEETEPTTGETAAGPVEEVNFTQASAHVEITGAFERTVDLDTVVFATYGGEQPNVGLSVIERSDAPTATFNVVFPIGTTTIETDESMALYLAFSVQDEEGTEHVFLVMEPGACSVTVEQATPDGVSGTWECTEVAATTDSSVVVDASGTFTASP